VNTRKSTQVAIKNAHPNWQSIRTADPRLRSRELQSIASFALFRFSSASDMVAWPEPDQCCNVSFQVLPPGFTAAVLVAFVVLALAS
jgi:hypothetical protein